MRAQIVQSRAPACQICSFIAARQSLRPRNLRLPLHDQSRRQFTSTRWNSKQRSQIGVNGSSSVTKKAYTPVQQLASSMLEASALHQAQIEKDLRRVTIIRDELLANESIPTERDVETALAYCEVIADALIVPEEKQLGNKAGSAASALLDVDEPLEAKPVPSIQKVSAHLQMIVDQLSEIAFSIIAHPTVFISPSILEGYVNLQSRLGRPESFPEVFRLYAKKPVPVEGSSPIKYNKQNPNKVANAINADVADRALQAAIDKKQLVVAMDVVDTTYTTKASHRAKFIRKGLLPATGVAVAPLAAYAVASQLSEYQSTMDASTATNIAFVGILAYLGFTGTIGVVALTTANDQMDRVTWAQGMPLRLRWMREEERAAIDKIAGAWGFRETWRRGEEEGDDWDLLREWVGRRGMILDRPSLMEGME